MYQGGRLAGGDDRQQQGRWTRGHVTHTHVRQRQPHGEHGRGRGQSGGGEGGQGGERAVLGEQRDVRAQPLVRLIASVKHQCESVDG